MRMSYEESTKESKARIEIERQQAKHGEFFFAEFDLLNGEKRKSPVFVIGNEKYKDDDLLICSCTSQPPRSIFDIRIQLKKETYVRTNKIYLIQRNQLLFKIPQIATPDEYSEIIAKLKLAMKLN
jgi:hypothetical protein